MEQSAQTRDRKVDPEVTTGAVDRAQSGWDFRGRTVAVVGADGGIASAFVEAAAGEDVSFVLHGRRLGSLERLADTASAAGATVRCVTGELADESSDVACMITETGEVDVLVNAAGVYTAGDLLATDPATICHDFDVNAVSAVALMQAVLPGMNERGYGRIVNISSGGGSFGEGLSSSHAAYAISKAALNAGTVLASKAARPGVLINAMCPGWVRTRMGGSAAPRSPAEGADTGLWLATLPDDGPNGGFFRDRKPIPW